MTSWDSQHYLSSGLVAGIDAGLLARVDATARRMLAVNPTATVIVSLGHLASLCDVPYGYLRRVIRRDATLEPYRVFALARGGHGPTRRPRTICAPEPLLLRAQRWIHANVLQHAKAHAASTAYAKGCSVVEAARVHCGASWLIKLDVSNFFDSILEPKIYQVFLAQGYQPLVAFELARLCTRVRSKGNVARSTGSGVPGPYVYPSIGHLPQGAPTSPLLANLVSFAFDEEVSQLARRFCLRYTRYADDMTLSFRGTGFDRTKAREVIGACYRIMLDHSLWPNRTKTQVIPPGARKLVLGLLVDGNRPALTREFREQMRMHLHFLETQGPVSHAQHRGFGSVIGLQNHLFGLAAHAMGVNKAIGRDWMYRLQRLPWPAAFEMPV
ncbi:Reverse transcriptase (RNA-dependent DNA polymerase) [Xylophilus ampelinus]|nr:RNA-directed DNA polymerase [Variovorax sp.]VTY36532.1 Reverse transcriptase (RNA-dependent DNA polymerase) [Xylophilus ampelinus]